MIAKFPWLSLCLLVAACGSSSGPPGDGGNNGGPEFLSFGTNVTTLTQTTATSPDSHDSVTFVAVVTHPQGVSDLVGGHLTDATGSIQYGAFIASQQGSYSLSLTWDQIYQATQFQFTGKQDMSFVAQFFDAQGRSASNTTKLTLACGGGAGFGTCDSACEDLQNDATNCGKCGGACSTVGSHTCKQGLCSDADIVDPTFTMSCDQVCAAHGGVCGSGGGYVEYDCTGGPYYPESLGCADVPATMYMGCPANTSLGYQCLCSVPPA
jgi:hypothetical protein